MSYPRTPTTSTSAATTTPNVTPNEPYAASPATPTDSATPSASTPSKLHSSPNPASVTAIFDADDAQVMAEMARGRMRSKIPVLVQALTGNFGEHHSFLCRLHLTRIDELSATIEELSVRIEAEMRPFTPQLERLVTIPGVKKTTAEVIIAETGADMTRFRTPEHAPARQVTWQGAHRGT